MECRWCKITDETYPYWKNRFCCDKEECVKKDNPKQKQEDFNSSQH